MSRRDGAIVAWHEVPGTAPPQKEPRSCCPSRDALSDISRNDPRESGSQFKASGSLNLVRPRFVAFAASFSRVCCSAAPSYPGDFWRFESSHFLPGIRLRTVSPAAIFDAVKAFGSVTGSSSIPKISSRFSAVSVAEPSGEAGSSPVTLSVITLGREIFSPRVKTGLSPAFLGINVCSLIH